MEKSKIYDVAPRQARDDYKQKLLIIAGPTSSGKSALAVTLAQKFNGEIVSADSRQVYRGMDIGTGKVGRDKRKTGFFSSGVRHWMLDVASPKRQYTVVQWRRGAQRAVRDITRRGKLPIICGGTGFYMDALIYRSVIPEIMPDAELRARLGKLSASQLFARLRRRDPVRAAAIDPHNKRRLIRALEIIAATGKPVPATGSRVQGLGSGPYDVLYLALHPHPPTLRRSIEKRLDARLGAGMIAEVRRLHESGVSWRRLESFGLEYRWVARYLQQTKNEKRKSSSSKTMRDGLLHDIIRYAKRQLAWWRRNPDIRWARNANEAVGLVHRFIR